MPLDPTQVPLDLREAFAELAKRIDFEFEITKAGSSCVYVGRNKITGRQIVVKFYQWSDGARIEPQLLVDLACEHLIEVHDAADIDGTNAYFITPYCENGDLDNFINSGRIGIQKVADLLVDLASGVSFLHGKGFLHRDLKPSNIFKRSDGRLVIGDFGSVAAKGAGDFVESLSQHSRFYRPPETIQTNRSYDQSDIYQLGLVMYQLLGGPLPYDPQAWLTPKQLAKQNSLTGYDKEIFANRIIEKLICQGKILDVNKLPPWCPPELRNIIRDCCRLDLTKRHKSASTLAAKINNIRHQIADWRFEPHPVLYRPNKMIRIVGSDLNPVIEKKSLSADGWRRVRSASPTSLREAVDIALKE